METRGFDSYIFVYSGGSSCREASELVFLWITCEALPEVDHPVLHPVSPKIVENEVAPG